MLTYMITNLFNRLDAKIMLAIEPTILAAFFAGCASAPTTVQNTVGPAAIALHEPSNGYLTVYSATESITSDSDQPAQFVHTDYKIIGHDGSSPRHIANGGEDPVRVTLRKGAYTVVAQSDTSGTVSVPVAIEASKLTVLHLERDKEWQQASVGTPSRDLVRLPNGQPIGYRAQQAELLHSSRATVTLSDSPSAPE
jgi:hypothetical protein